MVLVAGVREFVLIVLQCYASRLGHGEDEVTGSGEAEGVAGELYYGGFVEGVLGGGGGHVHHKEVGGGD